VTKDRTFFILKYVLLSLFAVPWIVIPMWAVLVNSAKTPAEAAQLGLGLPTNWNVVENYATVFTEGDYLPSLLNSLAVTVPAIIAIVLLGSAAAWAFGRSKSRSLKVIFYVIALSMLIPPTLIPTIFLLQSIQLDGTLVGYVLVMIGTRMGIVVFLATGFVRTLPDDLEAAATIDGANRFQIFTRIVLPLLTPVLFSATVILIVFVWSDFFFAQFLLAGPGRQTLPLALYNFANSSGQTLRWNLVFAHVILTALPLLLAYVLLQKRVVGGLTEGALR
jgi:raffinose/stachyose/melibiose transport system permease protein